MKAQFKSYLLTSIEKAKKYGRNIVNFLPSREFFMGAPPHVYENTDNYYNAYDNFVNNIMSEIFDGSKFLGSFGATTSYKYVDYWTLRERSMQLFMENPYCKGIIRRLLRNEINTGLKLEAAPNDSILGISEEAALSWAEDREMDWKIWSENPNLCDWKRQKTLGDLEADARMTALISGDVLVILRVNNRTGLPAVDLIDGRFIQTPFGKKPRAGNKIKYGVEIDAQERHVAYWVQDENFEYKRIPAWGEKSGRRLAWIVYGSERMLDNIRGLPILANMLYMLKELDRYRDSEQRAAVVNSMIAYFIKRDANSMIGSRPVEGGALRRGSLDVTQPDGSIKSWQYAQGLPGAVMQTLDKGETPEAFMPNRPNVNFGKFEEIIINTFAWTLEVPPEIVRLLFQNNFSASRQANNEFTIYLNYRFNKNGKDFNQKIYQEWLIQQVLLGEIQAPGFLRAWRDPQLWREFGAWVYAEWSGISRPSVDLKKDVDASAKALDYGFATHDWACRRISNISFMTWIKKRQRELKLLEKAGISVASEENQNREPILQPGKKDDTNNRITELELIVDDIQTNMEDINTNKEIKYVS